MKIMGLRSSVFSLQISREITVCKGNTSERLLNVPLQKCDKRKWESNGMSCFNLHLCCGYVDAFRFKCDLTKLN